MSEPAPSKQRANRFGRHAEALACALLVLKGYRLLARNLRLPVGEIDIVARRGRTLAFVEVKARSGDGATAEALSPRQRRRIVRAAEWFLSTRPELTAMTTRFDLVLVERWRWPEHRTSAWRTDD